MKVFKVTARWVETYTLYVKADDADSAEGIVSNLVIDHAVEGNAARHDKDWTVDIAHPVDEEIDPAQIIEIEQ